MIRWPWRARAANRSSLTRWTSPKINIACGIGRRLAFLEAGYFSLRIRSAGLITSVRRMPNLSLTTTTSPWAISVPLTKTSSGSPVGALEFDHRALVELQQIADADAAASDLHRQCDRDVQHHVEIQLTVCTGFGRIGLQIAQGAGCGSGASLSSCSWSFHLLRHCLTPAVCAARRAAVTLTACWPRETP